MQLPPRNLVLVLLGLLTLCSLPGAAVGGQREAAAKVREGIERFNAGDFKSAADAFAEADLSKPEDVWIAYDRAVAYAAQGDADKATELWRKAVLSRDRDLAARAHYNLGCLAANKARGLFGEQPEKAAPQVRQQGLGLLAQAVGHYRDCIHLAPDHAEARYNLELIRLWIKHVQAAWEEQDRKKQRSEMGLLEFLEMLQQRQRVLRATSRALGAEPDSPRRRQALSTTQTAQRTLAEEIEPLKEKIKAEVEKAAQAGGATAGQKPAPSSDAQQKAIAALTRLADEAGQAMREAAERLHGSDVPEAVKSQAEAVEKLDRITVSVIPFVNLLHKAIGTQQALVEQVARSQDQAPKPQAQKEPADLPEAGWNQGFLPGWSDALAAKASHDLKQVDAMADQMLAPPAGAPAAKPTPNPEELKKQRDALKHALEKAVQLCPKVRTLTQEAAGALKGEKPAVALPKQEEALRLLKEIADALPKQDQQQGEQNKPEKKPEEKPQDRPGQEQKSPDQQQARQPKDASGQQVESILRRARERQRERQELEKEMQRGLYRPEPVEKDW